MLALRCRMAVALVVPAALAAAPARAQDVQYETVTKVELPGAAGTAMRMAARLGGGSTETVEKTSIKGRRMRTDVGTTSTILDLEGKRFIYLDNAAKTYSVYTFDELLRKAQQTSAQANTANRPASGPNDAQASFNFRFSVEPGNARQQVAGYAADRFFLIAEAEGEYVPEGSTEREKAGTLVVLSDMWTSKDVPVFQARSAFDDPSARQYADAGAALMQGLAAAFADDPRMKVALQQSVSEARKIQGMPVKTVTSFVSVAPGQRFDRAQITEPAAAQQGGGARQAGRAALGRLGGAIRGATQQQQPAETGAQGGQAAQPTQATIFTVTSEIRNVRPGNVDASLFEIPAGYRQITD